MSRLIVLYVVVGTTVSPVLGASPCCMPDQWTANVVQSLGEYNQDLDSASLAYGNTDYFYDSAGNQTAYKQKLDNTTAHTMTERWVIMKYKTVTKKLIEDNVDPDQTVCMHRLIWIYVGLKSLKGRFSRSWLIHIWNEYVTVKALPHTRFRVRNTTGALLKTGKKYIIQDGKCTTMELVGQILPRCIPDDAQFLGTHFYPSSIKVGVWLYFDDTNGNTRRIGLTQPDCMPVTLSGLTPPPDFVLSMNLFQNVTKGISDPSLFDVPAICK